MLTYQTIYSSYINNKTYRHLPSNMNFIECFIQYLIDQRKQRLIILIDNRLQEIITSESIESIKAYQIEKHKLPHDIETMCIIYSKCKAKRSLNKLNTIQIDGNHQKIIGKVTAGCQDLYDYLNSIVYQQTLSEDRFKLMKLTNIKEYKVIATLLLIAICVFSYIFYSQNQSNFAVSHKSIFEERRIYTLISYQFMHGSLLHILCNMVSLYFIGSAFERKNGFAKTLLLYVFTGIYGGIASAFFNISTGTVGASGAIYGLLGALIMDTLHRPAWDKKNKITSIIKYTIITLIGGLLSPATDNICHLIGLLSGFLLMYIITLCDDIENQIKLSTIHSSFSKISTKGKV